MNSSLILGLIVIVAFVLIRIGQQDGNKKFGAIWVRFNQAAATTTVRSPAEAHQSSGWIKWILIAIGLVVAIVVITKSLGGFGGYTKTLELEVATLEPHQLCGVPTGEHTFNISKGREVEVFIGRDKYDITSTLRVNKTFPGEKFEVESNGCVSVSFSVNESFQKNKFARQIVAITFH